MIDDNVNKNENIKNINKSDDNDTSMMTNDFNNKILCYRKSSQFALTKQVGVASVSCTISPTRGNYTVTNFDIDDSFLSPKIDNQRARSSVSNVTSMGTIAEYAGKEDSEMTTTNMIGNRLFAGQGLKSNVENQKHINVFINYNIHSMVCLKLNLRGVFASSRVLNILSDCFL